MRVQIILSFVITIATAGFFGIICRCLALCPWQYAISLAGLRRECLILRLTVLADFVAPLPTPSASFVTKMAQPQRIQEIMTGAEPGSWRQYCQPAPLADDG